MQFRQLMVRASQKIERVDVKRHSQIDRHVDGIVGYTGMKKGVRCHPRLIRSFGLSFATEDGGTSVQLRAVLLLGLLAVALGLGLHSRRRHVLR